jgi:hypothetical protein
MAAPSGRGVIDPQRHDCGRQAGNDDRTIRHLSCSCFQCFTEIVGFNSVRTDGHGDIDNSGCSASRKGRFFRKNDLRTLQKRFNHQLFQHRIERLGVEHGGRWRCGTHCCCAQGICCPLETARLPQSLFQHILRQSSRQRFSQISITRGIAESLKNFRRREL